MLCFFLTIIGEIFKTCPFFKAKSLRHANAKQKQKIETKEKSKSAPERKVRVITIGPQRYC